MSDNDFQGTSLVDPRKGRRTYLVTYSQANTDKFPTRKSFGEMIERHFNGQKKLKQKFSIGHVARKIIKIMVYTIMFPLNFPIVKNGKLSRKTFIHKKIFLYTFQTLTINI